MLRKDRFYLARFTILLHLWLGLVSCRGTPLPQHSMYLHTLYTASLAVLTGQDDGILQVIYISDTQLFMGLVNDSHQVLGEVYDYTFERGTIYFTMHEVEAMLRLNESGDLEFYLEDDLVEIFATASSTNLDEEQIAHLISSFGLDAEADVAEIG
jgi:hypothetical protein